MSYGIIVGNFQIVTFLWILIICENKFSSNINGTFEILQSNWSGKYNVVEAGILKSEGPLSIEVKWSTVEAAYLATRHTMIELISW